MTSKDLQHIRDLNWEVYNLKQKLDEVMAPAYPGAIRYDDIGGSHGSATNKMEIAFEQAEPIRTTLYDKLRESRLLREQAIMDVCDLDEDSTYICIVGQYYIFYDEHWKPYSQAEIARNISRSRSRVSHVLADFKERY